jgi:hypothetical protein
MKQAIVFALLFCAGLATAQAPQKPAAAPPEERPASVPAAPAPRLNLKLDDAARYTREEPVSKGGSDQLPSLGAGAVFLEPAPTLPRAEPSRSPYPVDSEKRNQ